MEETVKCSVHVLLTMFGSRQLQLEKLVLRLKFFIHLYGRYKDIRYNPDLFLVFALAVKIKINRYRTEALDPVQHLSTYIYSLIAWALILQR
jgi:hypothetical protein